MGYFGDYRKNKYYREFRKAEKISRKEILKVFKHFWRHHRKDYKMLADMHKILDYYWYIHADTNKELAKIYDALWEKVSKYAIKKLKGEGLEYYLIETR